MKQGKADKSNNVFVGMGLVSNAYGKQALYGSRPPDGAKREPNTRSISPGYVSQLGNKVGNHTTGHGESSYTGEEMYPGKGFEAPRNKSQTSTNKGSQGRY